MKIKSVWCLIFAIVAMGLVSLLAIGRERCGHQRIPRHHGGSGDGF
jgi:hypothetical protein